MTKTALGQASGASTSHVSISVSWQEDGRLLLLLSDGYGIRLGRGVIRWSFGLLWRFMRRFGVGYFIRPVGGNLGGAEMGDAARLNF